MKKNRVVTGRYDGKPLTTTAVEGPLEERGYDGKPLSQAVTQDPLQSTGQDSGREPSSTQDNAGTGTTASQDGEEKHG